MRKKTISLILVIGFLFNFYLYLPSINSNYENQTNEQLSKNILNGNKRLNENILNAIPESEIKASQDISVETGSSGDPQPVYSSDLDLGKVLADRENTYSQIYEPWKSKAAIHAMAYDEETGFLALAGGYLYDDQIHIYRLNPETGDFDKVWDSGDQIIQSDVLSLDFGDTDLNDFIEIVAGSADGHIYVFEQNHIFDPYTNTENQFEHVWTSPSMFRVFDVKIEDVDRDYRPDIIAGTWDGLFLYEYEDHSGYPFVEDHWITYDQVWNQTLPNNEKIYSLETGDTNRNGLPEIITGTRSGTVFIIENAGESIMINDQPFPLIRDNFYQIIWSSENYTWTPIRDMAIGEIDGDLGEELAINAQGQGLFTLDWNSTTQTFHYQKIMRDFEQWETYGYWGLDHWADKVVRANNVTYPLNVSYNIPEPISYEWTGSAFIPDADVYPYNTGMASEIDGNYSIFDASEPVVQNATAVIDFGKDEEGTGSANSEPDVIIHFENILNPNVLTDLNFSISQNGQDFEQVYSSAFEIDGKKLLIDVDDALIERQWDWFRYAQISVFNNAIFFINAIYLEQVYNLLTDALSLTIGPLRMDGMKYLNDETELDKIVVGTVNGKYWGIGWNTTLQKYEVMWDSGNEERYYRGTGIWDLEYIPLPTDVPIWKLLTKYGNFLEAGASYTAWSFSKLDPFSAWGKYLVGTSNGELLGYDVGTNIDPELTDQLASINSELSFYSGWEVAAEPAFLPNRSTYPSIAVSWYNPEADPSANQFNNPNAYLKFFYRDTFPEDNFSQSMSVSEFDLTGEIYGRIKSTTVLPKMKFVDMDSDGDEDMIFTTGKLHYAKNLRAERLAAGIADSFKFVYVRDYFADINAHLPAGGWGQPDVTDLDQDGDLDIVLNYAYKNGTTAFLQDPTNDQYTWKEDRRIFWNYNPDSNMKLLNLTDTRILESGSGHTMEYLKQLYDYIGLVDSVKLDDFILTSFNGFENKLYWANPVWDGIDSYMVATFPEVIRTEFSLIDTSDLEFKNYGFNIRESWSTEEDLEDWSLSIASGDLDSDGNGELIVGDFDNNVYVFENLINNTYKRMDSTFDLNYTKISNSTPYIHQELEGISGNFMRKIWDHAKHLLTDVDLDRDGLKELIIATDLQIYVFEDKNLTGGDDLGFIYAMDIRELGFMETSQWSDLTQISSLTYSNDIDNDGRRELILTAGSFLWVFNVGYHNYAGMLESEIFHGDTPAGRYDLIGNPFGSPENRNYTIQTVVSGDTDRDGNQEIILGGKNSTNTLQTNGFVKLYEVIGGIFLDKWTAPIELTAENPVNVIKLDDQDYDTLIEMIVGHTKGIDIWEHLNNSDADFQKVEYITADPNYPILDVESPAIPGELSPYSETAGGFSDFANGKGSLDNLIMYVYENQGFINWRIYDQNTGQWSVESLLFDGTYGEGYRIAEMQPSVTYHAGTDTFYVVWRYDTTIGENHLWVSIYNPVAEDFSTPARLSPDSIFGELVYPDIVSYNDTHVLITFVQDVGSYGILYYMIYEDTSFGYDNVVELNYVAFDRYNYFNYHSASIVKRDDGTYVLAFSAISLDTAKPDYDIWVLTLNESFSYLGESPYHATQGYENDIHPDINYLRSADGSLVLVYENGAETFEEQIRIVSSQDQGKTWTQDYNLNVIPSNLTRLINEEEGYYEWYWNSGADSYQYYSPLSYSPSIIGFDDEGFLYSFVLGAKYFSGKGQFTDVNQILTGINFQSDWTGNHLQNVIDLDVGDTDNDGRQEIVAGWGHQAASYEMKTSNNGTDFMEYREAWLSNEFDHEFTGVTLYDTKGNGFEEIGISTKRGNVFLFEYQDPSEKTTPFLNAKEVWSKDINTSPIFLTTEKYDFNEDGSEELIVGGYYFFNDIHAFDAEGNELWNTTVIGELFNMELIDITNDSIPEILFSTDNGRFYAYEGISGTQLWNTSFSTTSWSMDGGDLDGDGWNEILIGFGNGSLGYLEPNGTFIDIWGNFDSLSISNLKILNPWNSTDNPMVLYIDTSGVVRILYGTNGSLYYESAPNIGPLSIRPIEVLLYDFTGDDVDEVVFGGQALHILDLSSKEIIYNSTIYGQFGFDLYIDDFDDDNSVEVLAHTANDGIFLEDIKAQKTQWHYNPEIGEIFDTALGQFNPMDLADELGIVSVGTEGGYYIVLDPATGIPEWFIFEETAGFSMIEALTQDSESEDAILVTDYNLGKLNRYEPLYNTVPNITQSYGTHFAHYEISPEAGDISNLWVGDITGDGFDDAISYHNAANKLFGWDIANGNLLWTLNTTGSVKKVEFGEFDGDLGNQDILVWMNTTLLRTYHGLSGALLNEFAYPTADFTPLDLVSANFDPSSSSSETIVIFRDPYGFPFLASFDSQGTLKHYSSANFTDIETVFTVGDFLGDGELDFAINGEIVGGDFGIQIYDGTDLSHEREISLNYVVTNMRKIDINGDTTDDIAVSIIFDAILLYDPSDPSDVPTASAIFDPYTLYHMDSGDLDSSYSFDEIIVSVKHKGLKVYNTSLDEIAYLDWPNLADNSQTRLFIEDWGDDGDLDVAFSIYNYLNIFDDTTWDIDWTHTGWSANLDLIHSGDFGTSIGYGPGFLYTRGHQIVIISGNPNPGLAPSGSYITAIDTPTNEKIGVPMDIVFFGGIIFLIPIVMNFLLKQKRNLGKFQLIKNSS